MRPFHLLLLFILSAVTTTSGQKVKYKDLSYLISQKKYEEAEPFLKRFLSEEKNSDHPNANYQMAVVYKRKFESADIFQESDKAWIFADSAIHFFTLAKELITDKEVKRNSDYYEEFKKRDLRTGKESIRSFDVHFAIDETIEEVKERQIDVGDVNGRLLDVISKYNKSRRYFIDFKKDNRDYNEMLLRANLKTIGALDHLIDTYDSFLIDFDRMKIQLAEIPNSGYSQQVRPQKIEDFIKEGETDSHFLDDDIRTWDYKEWARSTKEIVIDEILPVKSNMVDYDRALDEMLSKASNDSIPFTTTLNALVADWKPDILRKYDEDPLPEKLFALRVAELEYFDSMLKHKEFDNSQDYSNRIRIMNEDIHLIQRMDSIVKTITKLNIDEQIRNYRDFVENRYNGYLGLDKFLKDKLSSSREYLNKSEETLEWLKERNSYMAVNSNIFFIDSTYYQLSKDTLNYQFMMANDYFGGGLLNNDEIRVGYVHDVNPQRTTNIFYEISLDSIKLGDNPGMIGSSDDTGQVFYVLYYGDTIHVPADIQFAEVSLSSDSLAMDSVGIVTDSLNIEAVVDASNGTDLENSEGASSSFKVVHSGLLCKIYRVDGIVWKTPVLLKDIPIGIRINDLGDLIIDEISEEEGRARSMLVISNKDGEVKNGS